MRHMSFALTTEQIKNETKTETRRMGWKFLKAGDKLWAVKKAMGLKKGEKVEKLCQIVITSVNRESLNAITQEQVIAEGFPEMSRQDFISMFCKVNKCNPDTEITRIVFRYIKNLIGFIEED